jgi:hypothetical protein
VTHAVVTEARMPDSGSVGPGHRRGPWPTPPKRWPGHAELRLPRPHRR